MIWYYIFRIHPYLLNRFTVWSFGAGSRKLTQATMFCQDKAMSATHTWPGDIHKFGVFP